jgi:hypothetical protein
MITGPARMPQPRRFTPRPSAARDDLRQIRRINGSAARVAALSANAPHAEGSDILAGHTTCR